MNKQKPHTATATDESDAQSPNPDNAPQTEANVPSDPTIPFDEAAARVRAALDVLIEEDRLDPHVANAFLQNLDLQRHELESTRDRLLRSQAECANISRRSREQQTEARRLGGMQVARDLLGVVDKFARTLATLDERPAADPVAQGVRLVAEQLRKVLADAGVKPIEAQGQPFDPHLHEAMLQDPASDLPPGTVSQELERGYVMNDRVLRHAKVAVSAANESEQGAEAPRH